jgi:hypothetical protein
VESQTFSYRFAAELLESSSFVPHFRQILQIVENLPLLVWPGKSRKNSRLDVVQQCLNTYFDRRLWDLGWEYHPLATKIVESGLSADFRKDCGGLKVQIEVQFGNMARWYSDIFKFQTAYSQDLADVGVCIVPSNALAVRIDSNITNFERVVRELPSAKLSITLPILVIGVFPGLTTKIVDISKSRFAKVKDLTGKGKATNRYRLIHGLIAGSDISAIGIASEPGPMPAEAGETDEDDVSEE